VRRAVNRYIACAQRVTSAAAASTSALPKSCGMVQRVY
jgi:hypothetical protein